MFIILINLNFLLKKLSQKEMESSRFHSVYIKCCSVYFQMHLKEDRMVSKFLVKGIFSINVSNYTKKSLLYIDQKFVMKLTDLVA